jgi:hypothetical protein
LGFTVSAGGGVAGEVAACGGGKRKQRGAMGGIEESETNTPHALTTLPADSYFRITTRSIDALSLWYQQ